MVTTNDFRDDEVLGDLLEQVPVEVEVEMEVDLEQVSGDGIYDSQECYAFRSAMLCWKSVGRGRRARAARPAMPPRHATASWGAAG